MAPPAITLFLRRIHLGQHALPKGLGWKEYQDSGSICGVKLPDGLQMADRLPKSIFTPATKAESGHDANISLAAAAELAGTGTAKFLEEKR